MSELLSLTKLLGKPDFIPQKRLESTAESLIVTHLQKRRSTVKLFPVTSDDLTTLLENYVSDLSLYDDLSSFGAGVEGITLFIPAKKPLVQVHPKLSESSSQNRFRSTLAHELGHVVLHDPMFQAKAVAGLFGQGQRGSQVSFRDGEITDSTSDLYEWQAWYFCRSLLMPRTMVNQLISELRGDWLSDIWIRSDLGQSIVQSVSVHFGVSEAMASIQLTKSGALCNEEPVPTLF